MFILKRGFFHKTRFPAFGPQDVVQIETRKARFSAKARYAHYIKLIYSSMLFKKLPCQPLRFAGSAVSPPVFQIETQFPENRPERANRENK
ncbi:hypothetical protein [Pseudodesulfovibrio sp.]|uniref:hypothetical protein n=1 Tax=Pseudodesulfovibrio sp. TaxID=2035812 RepID=UPI002613F408|nr:hypothetical protein [Pseudodesulfovibrio sp.]